MKPVRVGGCVGGGRGCALSAEAGLRRFEIEHALLSVEDALILLDTRPAEAVEAAALERIRNGLATVLRNLEPEAVR